jgi:hypothetical protein
MYYLTALLRSPKFAFHRTVYLDINDQGSTNHFEIKYIVHTKKSCEKMTQLLL